MIAPAELCAALLAALDAAEGRRKRRQRDTTPDAIGMAIKRELLGAAVDARPDAHTFERWLLDYCDSHNSGATRGALCAMAREVLEEWRLARDLPQFRQWLSQGAPSDDKRTD